MIAEPAADPELPPPSRRRLRAARPDPVLAAALMRGCLGASAACCAAAAVLLAALMPAGYARTVTVLAIALLAGAAALGRRAPPSALAWVLGLQLAGVTLTLAACSLLLRQGLNVPGLAGLGLLVCVLCAAAGWRAGALLALVAAAAAGFVAWSMLPQATAAGAPSVALRLGVVGLSIAAGLASGVLISQVIARTMQAAAEREDRFRSLLALAADGYWELDPAWRLVAAAPHGAAALAPLSSDAVIGQVPWELPSFECDAETLDALQADLEQRLPFRDLDIRWRCRDGSARAWRLSGEPRFDERGVFIGYWGVARDVSAVLEAHAALAATETRYQELFSRIPTPLVLHREGRVLDANPAALAMFGQADLVSMQGEDLLAAFEAGDSRERARRRMEALQEAPPGTALPVTDFKLAVQGRQVSVRATGVRVEAEGGPASLAIFVDDSERLAAEQAVRRSEALLAHLVATSPDLITLTDLETGRYAMVNQSFERMFGWTSAQVVGRSSLELGIWGGPAERERFVARLRAQGNVSDVATHFITRSGATVAMMVSASRFEMDRREYMVINARDVTAKERERLEREAILAHASIGIAVTRERRFVLTNRHFEQIYGWGSGELVGQPGAVVWANEADYAEVGLLAAPLLARGEPVELERPARRRDGSSFVARVRGRAIDPARPREGGTVWIVEDVTERRLFEQALARARDDAEAANRAKSAFLANTSHELRTPLNGMIGLTQLARDEGLTDARRRQYLEQIADSAQSLAAIISDILDLSKIEAGKLLIESTVYDLAAELGALVQSHAAQAAARRLALRLEVGATASGLVLGDPLRLRQIVGNFIANALKFTAAGSVAVRAFRPSGGTALRLEVQDSGPGLDDETRARLFRPFTQADQSTTRRYGGTGLGLSICRELATLMGGSVGVASRLGEGSTFWAELPLPLADAQAAAAAATPRGAANPPAAPQLRGARVLMVEDNPVNMMIAVALLERWGVSVAQAGDGQAAVDAVQEEAAQGRHFDAVLMDVQMPVMSGHEATRALRRLPAGRELPIVALTAAALVSEREEALRAGMNDFLTKPIDADRLRAALARWCTPRA